MPAANAPMMRADPASDARAARAERERDREHDQHVAHPQPDDELEAGAA